MRTTISVLLLIGVLSSSCTKSFYQVYRTSPLNDVKKSNDMLVYEDENCIITYHLWSEYGKLQFLFTNKTQSNIYLNVGESFFIKNGMAYDYFKNRAYTNTTLVQKEAADNTADKKIDLTLTAPIRLSQESSRDKEELVPQYSISSFEEKVVCIPYKTSKIFSEFMISEILYRDCNLFRFPSTKKQILTATFSKEDSPIKFSNRLEYFVGRSGAPVQIENSFYISEIVNYPEKEITELIREENCNEKSMKSIKVIKDASPDKFYIKYFDTMAEFKH